MSLNEKHANCLIKPSCRLQCQQFNNMKREYFLLVINANIFNGRHESRPLPLTSMGFITFSQLLGLKVGQQGFPAIYTSFFQNNTWPL